MINVAEAVCMDTASIVTLHKALAGSRDADNFYIEGGFAPGVAGLATVVPVGDRDDALYGEQLKPLKSGERQPELIQLTMAPFLGGLVPVINDYITFHNDQYKITRIENLDSGGYRQAIAAKENIFKDVTP